MVGSIVPAEGPEPWPELRILGLYQYHLPRELLARDHDVKGLIAEVELELKNGTVIDPTSGSLDVLLEGKLPYEVTSELVGRRLLEQTRGGFRGTQPQVVPLLLSIVATRVAHTLSLRPDVTWSAATDKSSTIRRSTGLGQAGASEAALVMAIDGLPQPRISSDHDLVRIGEFAVEHRELLDNWRQQLDALLTQLEQNAEVADDAIDSYVKEVEDLSDQVSADMQAFKLKPVAMSVSAVGAGALAVGAIGGNPVLTLAGGAVRTIVTHTKRIAIRVRAKRWRRTQPGRAYLLAAAQQGLIRTRRT